MAITEYRDKYSCINTPTKLYTHIEGAYWLTMNVIVHIFCFEYIGKLIVYQDAFEAEAFSFRFLPLERLFGKISRIFFKVARTKCFVWVGEKTGVRYSEDGIEKNVPGK